MNANGGMVVRKQSKPVDIPELPPGTLFYSQHDQMICVAHRPDAYRWICDMQGAPCWTKSEFSLSSAGTCYRVELLLRLDEPPLGEAVEGHDHD